MGIFGYTDLDGYFTVADDYVGTWAVSPAADGTVTKLSVYSINFGAGDSAICGVYNAADNSLVGVSDPVAGAQSSGWVDYPVSVPFTVYSANSYFLMVLVPLGASLTVYRSVPGGSQNRPAKTTCGLTTPPATCIVASGTSSYCITCTYSESTVSSLAGTIAGVSAITGAIGENPVTIPSLAGTIAGVSTVSGAVSKEEIAGTSLAGTIAGVSSISGELTVVTTLSLAGIVAGISAITGALSLWKAAIGFPSSRPAGYDADKVFDEDTGTWTSDADLLTKDGSRHKTQLVMIGMDLIYYEAI